ncbi:MAG: hypothetical protein RBT71_03870 [Flavobacteriales bacterium]|jgi:REP element-mobilizing transposase RayT|nr:hypothetical protein [Flavobacteriales bacterium]
MRPAKTHRHPRLRGHDYRHGAYFVTLCTLGRSHLFGKIVGAGPDARMEPNTAGRMALDEWHALPDHFPHLRLDQVQLMPDHLHAILILDRRLLGPDGSALRAGATDAQPRPTADHSSVPGTGGILSTGPRRGTLGVIISSFKAAVTYKLNRLDHTPGRRYWQPGYHDRIIRTTRGEFERIARYIAENPSKWR